MTPPVDARLPELDQSEDTELVNALTAATREADEVFQRVGGSSRHWTSECFLPALNKAGLAVVDSRDLSTPMTPTQLRAKLAIMTRACNHWKRIAGEKS